MVDTKASTEEGLNSLFRPSLYEYSKRGGDRLPLSFIDPSSSSKEVCVGEFKQVEREGERRIAITHDGFVFIYSFRFIYSFLFSFSFISSQ